MKIKNGIILALILLASAPYSGFAIPRVRTDSICTSLMKIRNLSYEDFENYRDHSKSEEIRLTATQALAALAAYDRVAKEFPVAAQNLDWALEKILVNFRSTLTWYGSEARSRMFNSIERQKAFLSFLDKFTTSHSERYLEALKRGSGSEPLFVSKGPVNIYVAPSAGDFRMWLDALDPFDRNQIQQELFSISNGNNYKEIKIAKGSKYNSAEKMVARLLYVSDGTPRIYFVTSKNDFIITLFGPPNIGGIDAIIREQRRADLGAAQLFQTLKANGMYAARRIRNGTHPSDGK